MAEFKGHTDAILKRAREAADAWRGEGKGSSSALQALKRPGAGVCVAFLVTSWLKAA